MRSDEKRCDEDIDALKWVYYIIQCKVFQVNNGIQKDDALLRIRRGEPDR